MGPSFKDIADDFRNDLLKLEAKAREFSDEIKKTNITMGDKGEVIAQSILAMRHLEDARMRYGKVIQYLNDCVSIYNEK